jgi:hypothetical protein
VVVNAKQLVLFAGPHKAAATSVEEFFYMAGAEHKRHQKDTFGLRYWEWPHINTTNPNDVPPHKIFGQLVTHSDDAVLMEDILNGIQEAWDASSSGVILGTEDFDRIGPYSSDNSNKNDGLAAMKRVVDRVKAKDVTVVVNYRTPRLAQWISIWKHVTAADNATYEDFMCDSQHFHERITLLATQMNPLQNAQVYLEQGWKVKLVDMGGVETAGLDVSHVIACEILGGICDDGFVRNHKIHQYHSQSIVGRNFTEEGGLSEDDQLMAEMVLRFRDCMYEPYLRPNKEQFEVLYNESVWNDCDPMFEPIYQQLNDSAILFRALVSQKECPATPDKMVTIEQVLNGEVPTEEEEFITATGGKNGASMFTEAILFPLILVGAAGYQVYMMYTSRGTPLSANTGTSSSNGAKGAAVAEAEMSEMTANMGNGVDDDVQEEHLEFT